MTTMPTRAAHSDAATSLGSDVAAASVPPRWRRPSAVRPARDVVVIAVLALYPFVIVNAYWERVATDIFVYALLAIGLNVITGYTGMLSLGQASFFGLGAYASALLDMRWNVPWPLCLLGAGAASGIVSLLVALPCLRLKSDFLGLVTLAFGSFFTVLALNWISITGGASGLPAIPDPQIGSWQISTGNQFYELILIVLVLVYLSMRRIEVSTVGRAWRALRDDELSAAAMGINVARYKLLSFVVAGVIVGFAGSLFGSYLSIISPTSFSLDQSLLLVEMVIVGGLGSLPGSVVGAAIFTILPEVSRSFQVYQGAIGGGLMVLAMIFRPQGLLGKTAFGQSMSRGPLTRWWWAQRTRIYDATRQAFTAARTRRASR